MEKGKIIVVEGACDGIGKTTQYTMLCNRLRNDGQEIFSHHFPSYGTYQGTPVERYLKGELGSPNELSPYFINSLYAIDRGITWYKSLKPLYEQGKIILFDRYTTSSLIYQTALIKYIEEKKKIIDYILDFEYRKIGIGEPDQVIFLHASFDLVLKMIKARNQNDGVVDDIYERDLELMKKVYENAMFIASYLSWDMVQCNDGSRMRSIDDIHEEVYSLVRTRK